VDIDRRGIGLTEQHHVTAAITVINPKDCIWKDSKEGCHLALHGLNRALVERNPMSDHTAWLEMPLDALEILARIERGRALDPRRDWVTGDDVELLLSRKDEAASVVVNDLDPRVLYHVVVLLGEKARDLLRDERFNFADHDALNIWVGDEGAGRDP